MFNKKIAVVGVNSNPQKFGYKIFTDLSEAGYNVKPVGVRGGEINGYIIYKSLSDLPEKPDIIITVVPPVGTEKTVDEAISLGIKEIWMQPGSVSETAVLKARDAGIKVTENACFMIEYGIW